MGMEKYSSQTIEDTGTGKDEPVNEINTVEADKENNATPEVANEESESK